MQRAIPWDRLFFSHTRCSRTAVYHRASARARDGASLPSPFVHAFSVRFPRINKIPLWRHTPGQRYNKPGNRLLTKCLKIIDNRAHNNEKVLYSDVEGVPKLPVLSCQISIRNSCINSPESCFRFHFHQRSCIY